MVCAVSAPATGAVVFLSDASSPGPRYRLSDAKTGEDTVVSRYIEAKAKLTGSR